MDVTFSTFENFDNETIKIIFVQPNMDVESMEGLLHMLFSTRRKTMSFLNINVMNLCGLPN